MLSRTRINPGQGSRGKGVHEPRASAETRPASRFLLAKFFGEKGTLHDFSQVIAPNYFHETSFFDSVWDEAQHFARRAVGK